MNMQFFDNSANGNGGALHVLQSKVELQEDSTWDDNTALGTGNDIYIGDDESFTFVECFFQAIFCDGINGIVEATNSTGGQSFENSDCQVLGFFGPHDRCRD